MGSRTTPPETGLDTHKRPLQNPEPERHRFASQPQCDLAQNQAFLKFQDKSLAPLHAAITSILAQNAALTIASVSVLRCAEWQADCVSLVSICHFPCAVNDSPVMIVFPASAITAMVDQYYGGTGLAGSHANRDLSSAEHMFAQQMATAMVEAMTPRWLHLRESHLRESHLGGSHLGAISLNTCAQWQSAADVEGIDPELPLVCVAYTAQSTSAQHPAPMFSIIYATSAFASLDKASRTPPPQNRTFGANATWQQILAENTADIRLPLRSVLARPVLSVTQLLSLRVGDILPIAMPGAVPLLVQGTRFAMASIGEAAGQAAVRIETLSHATDARAFQPDFVEI